MSNPLNLRGVTGAARRRKKRRRPDPGDGYNRTTIYCECGRAVFSFSVPPHVLIYSEPGEGRMERRSECGCGKKLTVWITM